MKLTKLQFEIIEHRLEVPDAIADCLCDFAEDELPLGAVTHAELDDAVEALYVILKGDFELNELTNVQFLVFEDCIDGSTVPDLAQDAVGYPVDQGGISQQKANAFTKAHEQLEELIAGGA